MATPLPIYAPMVHGVDPQGKTYYLYTSTVLLDVADKGGWITSLNLTNVNGNIYSFITASPFLRKQITFTISGAFTGTLESEALFAVADTNAFNALVVFDNLLTCALNKALSGILGKNKKFYGTFVAISASDIPSFDTSVSVTSFFAWYYANYSNWPLEFLGLLQVYQQASVGALPNSTSLLGAITPVFLQFKTNLYNLNRQVIFIQESSLLGGYADLCNPFFYISLLYSSSSCSNTDSCYGTAALL